MSGQELYEWLGSLTPEQRNREILHFDTEYNCLGNIHTIKLQDSPKYHRHQKIDGWDAEIFEKFNPCIILLDYEDDLVDD